jgi:DNA-binding MarR family transcriptional regulator
VSKIDLLHKAFESRVRLGIMSILMVNDWVDYKSLKEKLDLTDGNLASHINGLDKLEFLEINKGFIGKKTNTTYRITELGRLKFTEHIGALEKLIKGM